MKVKKMGQTYIAEPALGRDIRKFERRVREAMGR